jgi:hypothetical protein
MPNGKQHSQTGLVAAGTTLLALKAGFLCVISLLSTLRSPFVTSSPRFSSAKTAAAPPAGEGATEFTAGVVTMDGGGGGGGGGGGAPAEVDDAATAAVAWYCSVVIP